MQTLTLAEAAELAGVIGLAVTLATLVGGLGSRWLGGLRRRAQLRRLAELRTEGVKIRNAGASEVTDLSELASWQKRYDIWHREAEHAIRDLAEHEAIAWETIGSTIAEDSVAGRYLVDGQARAVLFMTADLRRLEEIRRRYSPTG